jgi:Rrf2 family protein
MALLYGKPTEYAIRALTYLAARPEQQIVSVQEIAQAETISSHHLSKVMNHLARGKMVQPLRGPGGGYRLIKKPDQITLWEVMGCLAARDVFEECAIGWTTCADANPCPLHNRWLTLRGEIQAYLEGVRISDLAAVASHKSGDPTKIKVLS